MFKAGNLRAELSMPFLIIVSLMRLCNWKWGEEHCIFFCSHSSFIAIHISSGQSEEGQINQLWIKVWVGSRAGTGPNVCRTWDLKEEATGSRREHRQGQAVETNKKKIEKEKLFQVKKHLLEFRFQCCSPQCENSKHLIWLTFFSDWETKNCLSFFFPRPCIIPLDCLFNRQTSQNEALFQKLAFTSGFPKFLIFGLITPMFCLNLILGPSSKH